jgi:hypothetical protein
MPGVIGLSGRGTIVRRRNLVTDVTAVATLSSVAAVG